MAKGEYQHALLSALGLLLFIILYYAEGMEIAVADLRDKDVSQLAHEETKAALQEIQRDPEYFFAQRQIFVVAIISFVALTTESHALSVPFYGDVDNRVIVFLVNFLFLNLTILWFCQVLPKRLAITNSEQFFSRSLRMKVWPLIQGVGRLNIPGFLGVKPRQLLPSRVTHYNISAHLYGYCVDQYSLDIKLSLDGSATITKTFLKLFLHGERVVASGYIGAGGTDPNHGIASADVKIIGVAKLKPVEDLRDYCDVLDSIYLTQAVPSTSGVTNIPLDQFDSSIEVEQVTNNKIRWLIKTVKKLPEGFQSDAKEMLLLMYSVTCKCAPGAFNVPGSDHWDELIYNPCRKLYFRVTVDDPGISPAIREVVVGIENTATNLPLEASRCLSSLAAKGYVHYPIQSGLHRLAWESLKLSQGRAAINWPSVMPVPVPASGQNTLTTDTRIE